MNYEAFKVYRDDLENKMDEMYGREYPDLDGQLSIWDAINESGINETSIDLLDEFMAPSDYNLWVEGEDVFMVEETESYDKKQYVENLIQHTPASPELIEMMKRLVNMDRRLERILDKMHRTDMKGPEFTKLKDEKTKLNDKQLELIETVVQEITMEADTLVKAYKRFKEVENNENGDRPSKAIKKIPYPVEDSSDSSDDENASDNVGDEDDNVDKASDEEGEISQGSEKKE